MKMDAFRRLLSLPKNVIPHSLIPLGYPAEQVQTEDRYRPERVRRNHW